MRHKRPELLILTGLELRLLHLEELFIWYTGSDRSISKSKWSEFAAGKSAGCKDPYSDFNAYWHVSHLSVDPAYHRRGVATALMENVKCLASKDSLPIVLLASIQGRLLYLKVGFRELGQANEGTLYAASVMAWYPESSK